ncbi:hypothetical protein V496_04840 [Pseudogymnoascus sp. VKM F-4515 (FW-2607)]|nr:hypothetical protein V496_04840 [Pseudogymnoascus sp. VKM F-4515 (FW-2607)]KFY87482.1 hypothetical protein V498_07153 [Pseudogymnoascus sp. VKM F-4517 (FW-2822)]
MHASYFIVALAAFARVALATPPACLIAALGEQTNPADIPTLCKSGLDAFYGNITEKCSGDNKAAAVKIYSSTCLASGVTITLPTSTSSSSSPTSTGSKDDSKSDSNSGSDSDSDSDSGSGSAAPVENDATTTSEGAASPSETGTGAGSSLKAGSSLVLGSVIVLSGLASQLL